MPQIGRHTIIGNSAAALAAIRAIRRSGDGRPIAMISAESGYAYSPVLTTYYIGGQIPRAQLYVTDQRFYRRYDVEPILGHRVEAVDTERRRLYVQGLKPQRYEQLLIASGASPRKLNGVEPDALDFVHTLRTVEDAERIRRASVRAREVVLLGAGLVSLQTIKAILPLGAKIWLLVGSDQVLSQQMDRRNALLIQERLAKAGVEILFGRKVEGVFRGQQGVRVVTSWGETLNADLVVVGKGVRPNRQMTAGSPIACDYGIVVDDRMRTSVEGVYAAGDVAQGKNAITARTEVIATWFNACSQGETAGWNMAGKEVRATRQIRENVTTLMGLVVVSLGESNPPPGRYEQVRFENPGSGEMRTLYLDGGRIVGALLIGRVNDAGVIRHCIANRTDVSGLKNGIAARPMDYARILVNQKR